MRGTYLHTHEDVLKWGGVMEIVDDVLTSRLASVAGVLAPMDAFSSCERRLGSSDVRYLCLVCWHCPGRRRCKLCGRLSTPSQRRWLTLPVPADAAATTLLVLTGMRCYEAATKLSVLPTVGYYGIRCTESGKALRRRRSLRSSRSADHRPTRFWPRLPGTEPDRSRRKSGARTPRRAHA